MRSTKLAAIVLTAMLACPSAIGAQPPSNKDAAKVSAPPPPPIQSGVFGFSGAQAPDSDPEGVVGECIWIFDAQDHRQIAKGDCAERTPGKFRVVLRPGRYVVHGPGGHRPVEIKQGQWVKIESIVALPLAP